MTTPARRLPALFDAARILALPGTTQFLRSKAMWGIAALAIFAAFISIVVARESGTPTPGRDFEALEYVLLSTAVVPLVSLFFGTAAMASEREAGTLSFLFTRPIRRSAVVLGKGVAALALSAVAVALIDALVWVCAGAPVPAAFANGLAALVLESVALTALFVLFGAVLVRSLYVGLAYVALYEGALGNALQASPYTITFHARTLLRHWSGDLVPQLYAEMPPESTAGAVWTLLIVAGASLAFAMVWVETREYGLRDRPKEE